ncbi:MAG TPA: LPS assembly protein LptD [Pyrinomonadaceae bacterium]|nr:LPS assembly protein LptD [Pyrinomonadaceae bacterium]
MRNRFSATSMRGSWAFASLLSVCLTMTWLVLAHGEARAQQPNPVERQVANPITDEPNVNPLTQEQPVRPRLPVRNTTGATAPQATQELEVRSDKQTASGPKEARVFVYEGNVDVRIGVYRLQADKVTVYEASNRVVAEGNVVFDQEPGQRITGSRAEWNYATKLGYFVNSTGFTNQTQDGTILYFTADSVEKVAPDKIIAINAEVTACEENVPKWSFKTARATITLNDRVRVSTPSFNVKGFPVLWLPYASVSIKRRDRASGFLTPTVSGSGNKGFRISNAYYQTLGRSADITLRNDIYTQRGLGFGFDLRTRANSRSYLNLGLYAVKDRIFGDEEGPTTPDQGGSSFYMDGVHYFPNGFVAAADVNITSSLAYRQVFSDTIQQAISPEERSQVFINKNAGDYSFNLLARTQVISLPNVRIRTRQLPSITLDKRPSALKYFERLPVYFSFEGGLEGISRKETVEDLALFRFQNQGEPLNTPSIVQRLDVHPQFSVPFHFSGWSVTATAGIRGTYYSNSVDPLTRLVSSRDVVRGYGEFELDVRPPALARNFRHKDGSFFFRHVIEPYIVYRKIEGITNFERIILTDYTDAIADTNEIEYGITNRFFTRRSTENISGTTTRPNNGERVPLSSQPYEALTITLRGKYFFDPYFGGALVPGRRNQFYPIDTFSGYSYGGVPRRFSPLNLEARYRPRHNVFADLRTDFNVQSFGVRNISLTFGVNLKLIRAFQSLYFTRAIGLVPSLQQFANSSGKEPGTQRGSQWSPSVFLGNPDRGLFGGASFFFDFQNRPTEGSSSLVSSVLTLGYTWDCCAVVVQNYHFNVGLRNENRTVFSFRLNGIGTFGTEQIGQRFP